MEPENNTQNIYAITKYDAELEVWRGTQEGLDVVIVQSGCNFRPRFLEFRNRRVFTKVSNGFNYFTTGVVGVVDVNDVVDRWLQLTEF